MNKFVESFTNETTTENGAITYKSSLNKIVDLFFSGAVSKEDQVKDMIANALKEDTLLALKVSFYLRDVREGQGKRDVIRALIDVLAKSKPELLTAILPFIPLIGRWKDVFENMNIYNASQLSLIRKMIMVGTEDTAVVGLMCKWMPRKGKNAVILTRLLNISPREYRKFIVGNSNTVEQLMCSKEWDSINFEQVPSVASKIYQKAFMRNSKTYADYVSSLAKGEAKVNASVLYPHDIFKSMNDRSGNNDVLDAQWDALPNYMEGSETRNVFPVIDTSGSMTATAYGNTSCMDVAVGLGIYIAQRNEGAFKNLWCNFSTSPRIYQLPEGKLSTAISGIDYDNWGMSTDLNVVFHLVLHTAVSNKIPESDMPKTILILSDMEFDYACGRYGSISNFNKIREQYISAGYEMPLVVFWNIQSRNGISPVRFDENGVILVGGYSPVIMKEVLNGDIVGMTPEKFVINAVGDKYNYLNYVV
jgi:hypothetical protein